MGSMKAKARRRHLHALTRRADYLRYVLKEDGPESGRPGRVYDIAELSALKAAIPIITAHYAQVAAENEKNS